MVARPGTFGGGERLASEVTKRLDPSRFDRTYLMSREPPARSKTREGEFEDFARELADAGVRLVVLPRRHRYALWAWSGLVGRMRRERPDILHTHMHGANVTGMLLGALAGVPVRIAHEHTWSFEGQPVRRLLDREVVARFSDAFVAVSREDRRRMVELERISPDDVVHIPNGIPTPAPPSLADPRGAKRSELGIDPEAPVVGTVSVLRPQKALGVLVRAAAIVRERHPGLQVLIAGPGPGRPALEALIAELGLNGTVRLLGPRTDVADLLRAFDLAVCSSDFEGSPLAVMEYMEAGLPVVSTAVGGIPDLVADGVNGILVERGDHEAMAVAISRLLEDPGLRERMGASGRERRRLEFDIEGMVRRIESLYEELWARKLGEGRARE